MFKNVKFPLLSDKIPTPFVEKDEGSISSLSGLAWKDLFNKGYSKESISIDDDTVSIVVSFISKDKTFQRDDKLIIPREDFDRYINDKLTKSEIEREIYNLKEEIKAWTDLEEYELCATLKDQIKFLREFLDPNLIKTYGKNRSDVLNTSA